MQRFLLLAALLANGLLAASGAWAGTAKATFAVHCYDVGASALDGKPGIISVERGWSGLREVDRVIYDPQQVTLGQLEDWLRQADTYLETLEASGDKGVTGGRKQ